MVMKAFPGPLGLRGEREVGPPHRPLIQNPHVMAVATPRTLTSMHQLTFGAVMVRLIIVRQAIMAVRTWNGKTIEMLII